MADIEMNYKKVRIFRCLIGILLLAALLFASIFAGKVRPPQFSAESGFYDGDFYLTLKGNGTIYYTLDSSDPDENSLVYTEPFLISDASKNDNKYCTVTDASLHSNEYLLEMGLVANVDYSNVPKSLIDKATVIRAVCIDSSGNRSEVVTKTYFVGYDDKYGYDEMNFISLVTDPQNLFDREKGIYVNGAVFDRYFRNIDPLRVPVGGSPANYTQRGPDWEREANITFFDTNGNILSSGNFGICIQGRGSRYHISKNLNVYERDHLTNSDFNSRMLGYSYDISSLNIYQGCIELKVKNSLLNELADGLNFVTRKHNSPYALFIDGEYWGNCYLLEPFKDVFFQEYYNVPADNVMMIKNGIIEIGNENDIQEYKKLIAYASEQYRNDDETYAELCRMIDMDSCIDYYAAEIYLTNQDWPIQNFALWKSRNVSEGKYSDGRWRWIFFDLDQAAYTSFAESDMIPKAARDDTLFGYLIENERFREKLEERMVYLAENNFNPQNTAVMVEKYKQNMSPPMLHEYERYCEGKYSEDDYVKMCDDIQTFFELRYDYIMRTYGDSDE